MFFICRPPKYANPTPLCPFCETSALFSHWNNGHCVKFCKWDPWQLWYPFTELCLILTPILLNPILPHTLCWPPFTPFSAPAVRGSSQHLNAVTSALISGVAVLGVTSLGLFILSLRLLRKPSPSSLTGVWNPSFRWPWRPNPECTEILLSHVTKLALGSFVKQVFPFELIWI